jgi:hypothetical protein
MNIEDFPLPGPSKITEAMLFRIIWNIRSRKSFLTGIWLREFYPGHPLWFNMFSHILEKGQNKYPHFRYYLRNICLLTPGEHSLIHNGTAEARIKYSQEVEEASGGKIKADWGKLEALAEELKEEYRKYFPTRRGLIIGYKYSLDEVAKIIGALNKKYIEDLRRQ